MQLFDALTGAGRGSLHIRSGKQFEQRPWWQVAADSERMAAGLQAAGVGPGTVLATVLTNSPGSVAGLLAVWLAGGAVASLPVPARAMAAEEYTALLAQLCEHVASPFLVMDEALVQALEEPLRGRVDLRSWESLPSDRRIDPSPPGDDELAFVQYSSGSTSVPKGCALSTRAIASQLETLADMLAVVPGEDTAVSWLPLSHDMGAFGCLLCPWANDFNLVLSSPERFMWDPRTWFGDIADFSAGLTAGTPSALRVAARLQGGATLSAPLELRSCVLGAEHIGADTMAAATEAFAPFGLTASAWMPAYGLAEATLAVTAIGIDEEPSSVYVDSGALTEGTITEVSPASPAATPMVALGTPCKGVEVELGEPGRLSEIHVRSASLASGYLGLPELTAERFRDGRLATGDLGFQLDGQTYVVGRTDDLLSVRGRSVYAREIEAAIDALDAVRTGCATIVNVAEHGQERLVMLAELTSGHADYRGVAREAARLARRKAGVPLDECLFLERNTLPKTPSGKIQRFRCRSLVSRESFQPLARVELRRPRGTAVPTG